MTLNQAAWLDGVGKPLRVAAAKMPQAKEGEVVIHNRALAINPVSWKIQDTGILIQKWPTILDYDVSGEIYEVGPGVNRFQEGDRVTAFIGGPLSGEVRQGAFQLYSVAKEETVAKLPDDIAFSEGCVIPVAFCTAVAGLCAPPGEGFNLPFPALEPKSSGKTIVIWGASSSTGVFFLQIARAAGVKTIAVASASNHERCKSYGAAAAIDYHQPASVTNVVEAVKTVGGQFVGVIDCISIADASAAYCISMLEQLGGGELGLLLPELRLETPKNVHVTNIFGLNKVTYQFWRGYLTPALEQGKLKCAPESLVIGDGLESLQKALDVQRRGVSAKKVVVTL